MNKIAFFSLIISSILLSTALSSDSTNDMNILARPFENKLFTLPNEDELNLDVLIENNEIQERIKSVAKTINNEYQGKELTLIMIMKGACFIGSDLMRYLSVPVKLEYIRCKSYGNKTTKGELSVLGLNDLDIQSKDVLLVDDVFDTGDTLSTVVKQLKSKSPSSIKSLVLLEKDVDHVTEYRPDYSLFKIAGDYVIGYGMDYKGYLRNLPDIYVNRSTS